MTYILVLEVCGPEHCLPSPGNLPSLGGGGREGGREGGRGEREGEGERESIEHAILSSNRWLACNKRRFLVSACNRNQVTSPATHSHQHFNLITAKDASVQLMQRDTLKRARGKFLSRNKTGV